MKNKIMILAAVIACMATACTKEAERFHGTEKKSGKPMTETEQKTALQKTALDVLNEISFTSEADLIEVAVFFETEYSHYGMDDAFINKVQSLRKETYTEIDPEEAISAVLDGMAGMLKSPTAVDVYKYIDEIVVNASLFDLTGIFRADIANKMWRYTECDDRIEFRFPDAESHMCVLTVTPNGLTTEVKISNKQFNTYRHEENDSRDAFVELYDDHSNITLNIPSRLEITLTADEKELANLVANLHASLEYEWNGECEEEEDRYGNWKETKDTSYISVNLDKIGIHAVLTAGEYTVKADATAKKGKAKESIGLYKGIRELLSECITSPYSLSRINEAMNAMTPIETAAEIFGKVEATVALGSEIFIQGSYDLSRLDEVAKATTPEEACEIENSILKAYLYYGQNKWQSRLITVYDKEESIMKPVIEFADGTQYLIGDFFNADFTRVALAAYGLVQDLKGRVEAAYDKFGGSIIR